MLNFCMPHPNTAISFKPNYLFDRTKLILYMYPHVMNSKTQLILSSIVQSLTFWVLIPASLIKCISLFKMSPNHISSIFDSVRPHLYHTCAILIFLKLVFIFNRASADCFVVSWCGIEDDHILKEMRITQLCSKSERTLALLCLIYPYILDKIQHSSYVSAAILCLII